MITLVATGVIYFSEGDEVAFFEWLRSISCVGQIKGVGRDLNIEIKHSNISNSDLRELIALFHRYSVDSKQLATFARKTNASWFRNKEKYWYQSVFDN
jgi:hypothetical protein